MVGTPGPDGRLRYLCSTYSNGKGRGCSHNWVERDVVVGFAVNEIRRMISDSISRKASLTAAIRRELQAGQADRQDEVAQVKLLRAQEDQLKQAVKATLMEKVRAPEGVAREAAEEVLQDLYGELKRLGKQIRSHESRAGLGKSDIEAEVGKTFGILEELHLFLDKVPKGRMKAVFESLGVCLTVEFDHPAKGQRRSVPKGGTLVIGDGGTVGLPPEIEAPGRGSSESAGAKRRGAASGTQVLEKLNRGDRI